MAGGVAQLVVGRLSDLFGRTGLLLMLLGLTILSCISFIFLDNVYLLLSVTSLHWFAPECLPDPSWCPWAGTSPRPGRAPTRWRCRRSPFPSAWWAGRSTTGLLSATPLPEAGFVLTAVLMAMVIPAAFKLRAAVAAMAARQ